MKVYIERRVYHRIESFYEASMKLHETLDEITVNKKVDRLFLALETLGSHAMIHPKARVKKEWVTAGYYEYVVEDFHFAYTISLRATGEHVVIIKDACHSLLNY